MIRFEYICSFQVSGLVYLFALEIADSLIIHLLLHLIRSIYQWAEPKNRRPIRMQCARRRGKPYDVTPLYVPCSFSRAHSHYRVFGAKMRLGPLARLHAHELGCSLTENHPQSDLPIWGGIR